MKTKQLFLTLGFLILYLPYSFSCSCYPTTFCELVSSSSSTIAFKGKVIDNVQYNTANEAIYIEIEKTYKGIANMTDTIKLYGGQNSAGCQIDLVYLFPIGTEIIASLQVFASFVNPDAITENFWESSTSACNFIYLSLDNDKVHGAIAPGLNAYPFEDFENDFANCNKLNTELIKVQCSDDNLFIFPNPVFNHSTNVVARVFGNSIEQINIYSTDGKLVKILENFSSDFSNTIDLSGLAEGIHVLEFKISTGGSCFRKIVIF